MAGGGERQLGVGDAEFRQGALAAAADANHLFEGVVGAASEGEQAVAGAQHTKQRRCYGVGTTDKLQAHGRRLGLQHPGKHPIQQLPALIAMAVAAHRSEVLAAESLGGESLEHPGQPRLHLAGVVGGGSGG